MNIYMKKDENKWSEAKTKIKKKSKNTKKERN